MDGMKDKQYSIGDEWLGLGCHSLERVLRMGWIPAKSAPNLSKKWTCHPPNHDTKSCYIMQSSLYGCYIRQTILHWGCVAGIGVPQLGMGAKGGLSYSEICPKSQQK